MSDPFEGDSQDTLASTRREFAQQADAMSRAAAFNASQAIEPFVRLLGSTPDGPVLDLACGPGIVSFALAQTGMQIVGVDTTAEMLSHARDACRDLERGSAEFREADAASLPFDDGAFAAAVTRLSIHHFPIPERVLGELHRVVRVGGSLVVGDVVASNEPAEARLHNSLERLRDPSHCRFLNEAEISAAIESAGFHIETIEAWANLRNFDEWAAIVSDARSIEPLREVMRALARAKSEAGIDLCLRGEAVEFTHHWRFIRAVAL
ncbi:MAG: methyltransferase domain-containing protein [bacterium]|nr:methyltransferase domain-containing protein [bacterium]